MFATARLIVRNDAAAEDATQEALMNAWRHLPSLRDPDRFEAWLYRLLVNACRTQLRKPSSHDVVEIEVVDRSRDGGDPSGGLVDRDQLERGFRRLDADQRAVLILHLYRGYTVPEVAEMVGIPVGDRQVADPSRHQRAPRRPRGGCPSGHRDRGEPAMSQRTEPGHGFEDQLARWFEQTAPTREPEDLLGGSSARRSRSGPDPGGGVPAARWTSSIGPRNAARRGLSLAVVLAVIATVLGAALFARSHPRLPLPLGRNGLLVAGRPGELLLIDPTGKTVARTATGALTRFGAWSHDGTRLAHADGTVAAPQLVITDPELRELLRLPLPASTVPFFSWSPDDRQLTFGTESDAEARVYVIDVAPGAVARPITDASVDGLAPEWSPDGALIALRAGVSLDQQALYVVRPDGTGLMRPFARSPRHRPLQHRLNPGRTIDRLRHGRRRVRDLEGRSRRIERGRSLTAGSEQSFCPSVSPDGARLATEVWQNTGRHITVQALGGTSTVLTPDGPLWGSWAAVWAPDGRTLAMNGQVLDGGPSPRGRSSIPRASRPRRRSSWTTPRSSTGSGSRLKVRPRPGATVLEGHPRPVAVERRRLRRERRVAGDQVGRLLREHHHRRVDVAVRDVRHRRSRPRPAGRRCRGRAS